MGKVRNKHLKRKMRRAVPDGALPTDEEVTMHQEATQLEVDRDVVPLLNQLDSAHEEEREYACCSISNLVSEDEQLNQLLNQGTIKSLLRNLVDSAGSVRTAASGALRNISVVGGYSAIDFLVSCDVLTPVLAQTSQLAQHQIAQTTSDKKIEDPHTNTTLVNLLKLLVNLSSSSEEASAIITSSQPLAGMIQLLNTSLFSADVVLTTGNLFLILSENNLPFLQQLQKLNLIDTLLGIFQSDSAPLLLRVYLAGVLLNVGASNNTSYLQAAQKVVPFLLTVVGSSSLPLLETVQSEFPSMSIEKEGEYTPQVPSYKSKLDQWEYLIKSQQIAIELLTNIATPDDESNSVLINHLKTLIIHTPVLKHLVSVCCSVGSKGTLCGVLALGHSLGLWNIVHEYSILLQRSLNCLNQLCTFLDPQNTSLDVQQSLWSVALEACILPPLLPAGVAVKGYSEEGITKDTDVKEAATSLVWTIFRQCPALEPPMAHLDVLGQITKASGSEIKVNCLGALGILGQQPRMKPILRDFANLLLENLSDPSIFTINEALNSIFDIFAEAEFNGVVTEVEMLPKLMKTLQHLRTVRSQTPLGNLTEEQQLCLEEAEENLTRFLEYKYPQFK